VNAKLQPLAAGLNAAEPVAVPGLGVSSRLSVSGEAGADLFLDGNRIGKLPMTVVMTKASAALAVRGRGGAFMAKLRLDPALRGDTALVADLQPTGELAVSSGEASARAYFDGVDLGAIGAGLLRDLPAGSHRLELVGDDTYWSREVAVGAGKATSVKAELRPVGRIDLRLPSDFQASISGGTFETSVAGGAGLSNVPAGDYSIQASSGDSPIFATSFRLEKGAQAIWEPCTFGFISLSVTPSGAACILGGDRSFTADESSEALAPGTYTAVLSRPGYRDKEISFSVFAGRRTRLSAALEELGRGALTLPRPGAPVELLVQGMKATGKEQGDGSFLYSGLPTGMSLTVAFVSTAGRTLALPDRKIKLGEGENLKLDLPTGRFYLPWLPEEAIVEVGSGETIALKNEGSKGFLSPPLAPGDYAVSVRGGPKGSDCAFNAKVLPGVSAEVEGYRGEMLGNLSFERDAQAERLSKRRAKTKWGVASLVTGLVGTAATTTFYFLGKGAKADYDAAETSADAQDRWESVDLYKKLFYASAAVGAVGYGGSYFLLRDRKQAEALRRSIEAIDAGIKALGARESGQ
jgi:hypothetical protein